MGRQDRHASTRRPHQPRRRLVGMIRDDNGNGIYDLRLVEFSDTTSPRTGNGGKHAVPLVLIPRPDNPFDSDAVSIALPKSMGGDKEERCLGYLYRHTIENWGIANGGSKDLVARLAALCGDGEVHSPQSCRATTTPLRSKNIDAPMTRRLGHPDANPGCDPRSAESSDHGSRDQRLPRGARKGLARSTMMSLAARQNDVFALCTARGTA